MIRLALVLALALTVTSSSAAASLPKQGVLVPGKSLAGVRLGDTTSSVRSRWGTRFRTCSRCAERTWYYTNGRGIGVGVSFRSGRVTTVFTLGSPQGWRTREGLQLGDGIDRANGLYRGLAWKTCIGYVAMSMRQTGVVTSIYASGESVYGFALTRPGEPVCQ